MKKFGITLTILGLAMTSVAIWRIAASPAEESAPKAAQSDPPPQSPDLQGEGLERFYDQQLNWTKCGNDQCARLAVPLDYDNPDGESIELAVLRVPATNTERRIGSLVVNPGGPGGSGIEYAAIGTLHWGGALVERYDIVGFDPRGVGESAAVECADTAQLDAFLGADPDPDTSAEVAETKDLMVEFGANCLERSGALLSHVSTIDAARDMDILRAAVGDAKLTYSGASYGTFLGATYAELFPDRVGRFVLDGAVDPSLPRLEQQLQQAAGFEVALRSFVSDCVAEGNCILGDSLESGVARIQELLVELDRNPLPTDTDRDLTEGFAVSGIFLPLYVESLRGQLERALTQVIEKKRGSALLALADMFNARGVDGYRNNQHEVITAVNCLDDSSAVPYDEVERHFDAFQEASPTFGRMFAYTATICGLWPVRTDTKPRALVAKGAAPIIVLGTTRDPATPLRWAEAMADQLESARLVIRDGDGHTAFRMGNECIDGLVEAYLIEGKVPADNTRC